MNTLWENYKMYKEVIPLFEDLKQQIQIMIDNMKQNLEIIEKRQDQIEKEIEQEIEELISNKISNNKYTNSYTNSYTNNYTNTYTNSYKCFHGKLCLYNDCKHLHPDQKGYEDALCFHSNKQCYRYYGHDNNIDKNGVYCPYIHRKHERSNERSNERYKENSYGAHFEAPPLQRLLRGVTSPHDGL